MPSRHHKHGEGIRLVAVWVLVGVAITILLLWGIKAIQGVQYWKRCETEFAEMISRSSTKGKALLRISMKRHPELSTATHKAIIGKFSELPLLVNFFAGALPDGRLDDEVALQVLEDTTIECLGFNRYKVKTRSIQKKQSPEKAALPQVKEKTGLSKNREMAMARRVWRNALNALGEKGLSLLSIGSTNEAKEIIEAFFVPDRVNPLIFWGNCEALVRGGSPSLLDLAGQEKSYEPTPSLSPFMWIADRPGGMPLWFIAAYPDVLLWHRNQLREYKTAHGRDEDGFYAKLYGLDLTDPNLEERLDNFVDSEGNLRPNTLRILVQSYKDKTGREFETALKLK